MLSPLLLTCTTHSCVTRVHGSRAKSCTYFRIVSLSLVSYMHVLQNLKHSTKCVCSVLFLAHTACTPEKFRTKVCRALFGSSTSSKHENQNQMINNKGHKGRGFHLHVCGVNYRGLNWSSARSYASKATAGTGVLRHAGQPCFLCHGCLGHSPPACGNTHITHVYWTCPCSMRQRGHLIIKSRWFPWMDNIFQQWLHMWPQERLNFVPESFEFVSTYVLKLLLSETYKSQTSSRWLSFMFAKFRKRQLQPYSFHSRDHPQPLMSRCGDVRKMNYLKIVNSSNDDKGRGWADGRRKRNLAWIWISQHLNGSHGIGVRVRNNLLNRCDLPSQSFSTLREMLRNRWEIFCSYSPYWINAQLNR